MAYETASQQRERIHEESLNDAFGPAKAKKPAAPAPPAPGPTVGQRLMHGAGAVGGAVVSGIAGTGHAAIEGGSTAWQGLKDLFGGTGPHPEDVGRGPLVEALSSMAGRVVGGGKIAAGLLGILSSPLSGAKAAAERYVESLPKEQQDAVALPEGQLVRELMGGGGAGPMTVKELAGHVAAAAVLAHGLAGGKGEVAKPGEAAPKSGTPQAARSAAADRMAAAQAKPAEAPAAPATAPAPKFSPAEEASIRRTLGLKPSEPLPDAVAKGSFSEKPVAPTVKPVAQPAAAPPEEPGAAAAAPAAAPVEPAPVAPADYAEIPVEQRSATPEPYTGPERRAVHEGTTPPMPRDGIIEPTTLAAEEVAPPGSGNGAAAEAQINEQMGVPSSEPGTEPTSEAAATPGVEPVDPTAQPQGEAAPATEAAPEGAAPAEGEPVQGAPQVQTIADLHNDLEPAVASSYGPPNEAQMKATKEVAAALAQELRAAGVKESEIRDAVRAKLNEGGILSQRQRARAAEDIAAPEGSVRAELNRIRQRIQDMNVALGGGETGAIGVEGDPAAALEAAKGLLRVITTRKLSAQMMEPGWITGDDPLGALEKTATKMGVGQEQAPGLVQKVVQAVKDRLNSTDPEGAQFNTAAMGFNPLDFFRLFHKDPDLASVPYDRAGAEQAVTQQIKATPGAQEALKLDLRKTISEEQAGNVRQAADESLKGVRGIMSRVEAGGRVEPGELQHAVTLAGVLAERARNAEARATGGYGKRGPEVVKPVNADTLHTFGKSLHDTMSEPELYGKLSALEPASQDAWLANMYRASTVPSLLSGQGLAKMYMSLFYNEALSAPYTFVKSAATHTAALPWTLATEGVAAQIGRFTKAETRVVPGQMGQLWAGYWSAIQDQWHGIASGDIQGLKLTMEQEGDLHLARQNPETMLDNILNVTSAPSIALGAIRSPIKVTLRRGALFAETFREVTQAAQSDPTLVGDKFWQEVEARRRAPSENVMKYANEFSDTWSFTKRYEGLRGALQNNAASGDIGRIMLDPFATVGINSISRAVEAHPFTAMMSPDFWSDVTTPGGPQNRALAKLALGSAILATTMGMGAMGWCTGDGPPDPHAQKLWQEAGNVPNTCINPATGKPTLNHKLLGFFSGWIASGADMQSVWQNMNPNDRQAAAIAMAYAISEQATHAGIVDTWAHIAKAIAGGVQGQELYDLLRDKAEAASLVSPNHIGAARALNDFSSDAKPLIVAGRAGEGSTLPIVEKTKALILQDATAGWPGWEKGQPQMRNQFDGQPILRPGLFKDTVDPSSPVAKIANEIFRLQSAQKGLKFDIAAPKRTIGGSVPVAQGAPVEAQSAYSAIPLDPWEYDRKIQFQTTGKVGGKTLVEALTQSIDSSEYKRHAAAEKDSASARAEGWSAARIREIYQGFETMGEQKLLKEDKHLQWLVNKSKAEAQNLQRLSPHSIPPEPPLTAYPRPGQNPR